MKQLLVFALLILFSCTKQASVPTEQLASRKGKGHSLIAEATQAAFTITNNNNGTFSVDYNGITNFDWMFFRGGNSLSTPSSNVEPEMTQSFWKNQPTTFTANFSGYQYYQIVIWTLDGQAVYSNVVQ